MIRGRVWMTEAIPLALTFRTQASIAPKACEEMDRLCLFRVLQEALQNAVKHRGSLHFQSVIERWIEWDRTDGAQLGDWL
jgi:glucose-6-phosphate-specific signal transduction histidine kinase